MDTAAAWVGWTTKRSVASRYLRGTGFGQSLSLYHFGGIAPGVCVFTTTGVKRVRMFEKEIYKKRSVTPTASQGLENERKLAKVANPGSGFRFVWRSST